MRPLLPILLAAAVLPASAAEPPRPAKLGLCAACHGSDGFGVAPGQPDLAGQDALYLRQSLAAYRDGSRRHAAMNAIAGTLSAADVESLAAWYAAQPACREGCR